jgi:hypothetical protein
MGKRIDRLKKRLRDWYLGEFIRGKYPGIVGHTERPFLARAFDFCVKEYKWVVGVIISILGLILAYLKL